MPKKMGENTKAVKALERKKQAKLIAQEKAAKEAEDKLWEDNDKILTKKKQRREEEEKKKADQARKKAEARNLLEQEVASIKNNAKTSSSQKITRYQIEKTAEQIQKSNDSQKITKLPSKIIEQNLPEENLNRQLADTIFATNIDQAIAVLSVNDDNDTDRHPEKRLKAAFKAFETNNLPRIKEENPTLRMSQWKQILIKEWNRSSENPLNQKL